eukprot:774088_1
MSCNANSCTTCIDQSDNTNFESCEWSNSGGYCFNWYDDPSTNGVQTKAGCPTVYIPIIICVIIMAIICIALGVWQRRRRRRSMYPPIIGNNYNQYNSNHNNKPVCYVVNPQDQYTQVSQQEFLHVPPPQQVMNNRPPLVSYQISNPAPVQPNIVFQNVPNSVVSDQIEGGYTHQ